jgi:hypothetical protein
MIGLAGCFDCVFIGVAGRFRGMRPFHYVKSILHGTMVQIMRVVEFSKRVTSTVGRIVRSEYAEGVRRRGK